MAGGEYISGNEMAVLLANQISELHLHWSTSTSFLEDTNKRWVVWDDANRFDLERSVQKFKFGLPEDKVIQNYKKGAKPLDLITPIKRFVELSEIGS